MTIHANVLLHDLQDKKNTKWNWKNALHFFEEGGEVKKCQEIYSYSN